MRREKLDLLVTTMMIERNKQEKISDKVTGCRMTDRCTKRDKGVKAHG